MTTFGAVIDQYCAGDDFEVRYTVTVPRAIAKAWLTIKHRNSDLDDAAIVQKAITTVNQAGVGQIEEAGDESTKAILRFDFTNAQSTLIKTWRRNYDLKVRFEPDGTVNRIEVGKMQLRRGVGFVTS